MLLLVEMNNDSTTPIHGIEAMKTSNILAVLSAMITVLAVINPELMLFAALVALAISCVSLIE